MDSEILQSLLNDNKAWETFVEEIELSREEGEVLREGMKNHKILTTPEGKEKCQEEQKEQKDENEGLFWLIILFGVCLYHYLTLTNTLIIVLTCLLWLRQASAPSESTTLREKNDEILTTMEGKEKHQEEQKNGNAGRFWFFILFVFCLYRYFTLTNTLIIALTYLFWMNQDSAPSKTAILSEKKYKILTARAGKEKRQEVQKNGNVGPFWFFILLGFCLYHYLTLANTIIIVLTCLFWMPRVSPPSETAILREKTLKVLPDVRVKLCKRIAQLGELADKADQVHKICTVANVAGTSAALASCIMSIMAIGLAPLTGVLSVCLSEMALGLGPVATAIIVTASIVEQKKLSSIEAEANGEKTMNLSSRQLAMQSLRNNKSRLSSSLCTLLRHRQVCGYVRANQLIEDGTKLAARSSSQSSGLFQRAFGSIAETMSWGLQVIGGVTTGLCVLNDAHSLVKQVKHLREGAKTEMAERIRLHVQELEEILDEVRQNYKALL